MKIDGVSMGSSLSPTLANIVMIALEDEIIKDLFDNGIIKFYVRYVDDRHIKPLLHDQIFFDKFHKSYVF